MKKICIKTPLGNTIIEGDEAGISTIRVLDDDVSNGNTNTHDIPATLLDCSIQLQEYFKGERTEFNLKLNPSGTSFQKKVWQSLQEIPYGNTISYLDLSKRLGDVKAIRAVASANGKNPLWIVVPCHRVIGTDGSLTGYAGGLWRKKWLLDHENPPSQQSLF
ncbi:methylated-DNA--[protein]-cysteine S-methyltransferase [Zhouia amylolytica]|uniref:methylated-DNA--[protein]-cysteine S-methyltransferase n=1 Tax=Zhouia amylolytica TaxID=376730 RepID=UPI0020CF69CB|nr:methylated-DNA--[protein]-cysteine S-methyltransferase [Zhouia amylolytica]MCQ0111499.1 methylated-DNA--[protein]-cysteine S-methyltransferase [Zhouia amylolytica]